MNVTTKSLLVAMAFGGSVATATAAPVITDVTASGPGLGSFSFEDPAPTFKYLSTAFSSADPVTLRFTVAHTEGDNPEHHIYETITNGTATAFTGLHLRIDESTGVPGDGVAFNYFNADHYLAPDFAPNFTLGAASAGPRELNFTGELEAGASVEDGYFNLNLPDPGAGNMYTFSLTQTATVGVVPEPETYAMLLAGLGLMGFMARRKQN